MPGKPRWLCVKVNSLHLVAPEASGSSRFLGGALLQD